MDTYKHGLIAGVCSARIMVFATTTVSVMLGYKGWKWNDVHIAKNEYISIPVVPAAGGRVLEDNLGAVPSLWVNPELLGKSFESTDELKTAVGEYLLDACKL